MEKKYKIKNEGFALLVAVLVSALFLAIGATIYRIALIEIILSSTGKDSQFAFYAADTGAECALFWDQKFTDALAGGATDGSGSAFSVYNSVSGDENGTNRNSIINGTLPNDIECAGGPISPPVSFCAGDETGCSGGFPSQTRFEINNNNICATVIVSKQLAGVGNPPTYPPAYGLPPVRTEIVSRGYNTCDVTNNRRVERAIKIVVQ